MVERIVLLGDSLGMPDGETVEYEQTYPYLLQKNLAKYEVLSRHRRTNTAKKQSDRQFLHDDIIFLKPSIVVIHLGIVDCWPRIFNIYESKIVELLPSILRNPIITFTSRRRYMLTRLWEKVYVRHDDFKHSVDRIVACVKEVKAIPILINIATTNELNRQRSFGVMENIARYNAIIQEIAQKNNVEVVDVNGYGEAILKSDGVHLTREGCMMIASRIKEKIKQNEMMSTPCTQNGNAVE